MLKEVIDAEALDMLYMVSELADGPVLTGERECVPLNQATAIRYFCHLVRYLQHAIIL
nr:AlNc14C87G5565 [Albugo laibachii Nc14]|eukprot:CCA20170.1 AlNc14C87G5565 [Albugo laibachii Nc14]